MHNKEAFILSFNNITSLRANTHMWIMLKKVIVAMFIKGKPFPLGPHSKEFNYGNGKRTL